MNDATPPLKQLNRTFIASVLFIDIVGYSMCTVPDQLEMKELFNRLLADAVQNVASSDRIMVDTGDGAAIAFLGDPEDALFAALALRDAVDAGGIALGEPGFVRMGINLGPLKIVRDINGHTNMIGDGVNDAQRVMSFADPGNVMVSHSYYDIISRFSRDYTQLFVYEGTRHDKHVREHEVYRFGPAKGNEPLAEKMRERSRARGAAGPEEACGMPEQAVPAAGNTRKRPLRTAGVAALLAAVAVGGGAWLWSGHSMQEAQANMPAAPAAAAAPAIEEAIDLEQEALKYRLSKEETRETVAVATDAGPDTAAKDDVPPVAESHAKPVETERAPVADAAPPAKPGKVKLAIQPWGEIYVDGSKRGISPPMKSLSLAPGKYRIEVRNSDFAPYKETIEVKSGGDVTVQYMF